MADGNPFLDIRHPIPFDRMSAEHVRPAVEQLLSDAGRALEGVANNREPCTYDNTLGALERLGERLARAMRVIGHLEGVATTPELREAYNEVQPKVSAFFSSIPLTAALYARLREFAQSAEARSLEATRGRHLKRTLESFERDGAALGEADKERLQALNVELSELTTRFGQNVLDSGNSFELYVKDRSRLEGLPQRVIDAAERSAKERGQDGYRFTLQEPSLLPVLSYLKDRGLRERMYRAHNTRATSGEHDNREILARILQLRREKARLLGFDNFVDLVTSDRMAKSAQQARAFLADLEERTRPAFERENAELTAFAAEHDGQEVLPLALWDVAYYAEKQRAALYDFDNEALRPYFALQRVLEGLFGLVKRLYGVAVEAADDMPVWDKSVRAFRLRDEDGSLLGAFYADLFPREQKRGGAWMNAFITSERKPEGWTPHVGLICGNLTPPSGSTPSLLSHREVETLFHEFGHLLHHLLSRVSVPSLAGTHVAWDFVELPSQIMENWCWERASLDLFARHFKTGEPIPDELFAKMMRGRTYRGANATLRQLGFGSVDLKLHADYDPKRDGDVVAYGRKVLSRFAPVPVPDDYAMITSFGHLFSHPVGYAGGYYSYKWAEVLDADAFTRFRKEGLFSREVGREFRDKILSQGDSRDPMDLFKDFMGREPDLQPLLKRTGIA